MGRLAAMITKAMRKYLSQIGQRGGLAGRGGSQLRGGKTEAEQTAYYKRISRKGVRARRAKARRGDE
jgi:hypothetical protein